MRDIERRLARLEENFTPCACATSSRVVLMEALDEGKSSQYSAEDLEQASRTRMCPVHGERKIEPLVIQLVPLPPNVPMHSRH